MKKLKGESGVAFDIAESVKEEFDARVAELNEAD